VTPRAITAIVFDIGGVLLDWDPRHLYRQLIDDPADMERFLTEVCTGEWNGTLDAGRPFDEAIDELSTAHPDDAELIHAWARQADMIAGEVPGTADLVAKLADRGVPLHLLTNMPADVFDERLATYPVLQRFAGAVVSGRDGVMKPTREAFALVAERFGVAPSTTLFIDDTAGNVEAARAVGFVAHHFTSAEHLAAELRALGLID
jgi:2-haloacid dehalogenase